MAEVEDAGRSHLQVVFRLSGPDIVPATTTQQTGVQSHRSYNRGDRYGKAAQRGLWEWRSAWSHDQDVEPLMAQLLAALGPHRNVLRRAVDVGARASVTVVGEVLGEVIGTVEEADRRGRSRGRGEQFEPYLASDRVGIFLDRDVLAFLVDVGATFATHIDAELDDGPAIREGLDSPDASQHLPGPEV